MESQRYLQRSGASSNSEELNLCHLTEPPHFPVTWNVPCEFFSKFENKRVKEKKKENGISNAWRSDLYSAPY